MKRNLLIVLIWLGTQALVAQVMTHEDLELPSYISILGSSNINRFSLNLDLNETQESLNESNNKRLVLTLPVSDFKSSKKMIYKDFLDLVDSQHHPNIVIEFNLDCLQGDYINTIDCKITLSGITNHYKIPIFCNKIGKKQVYIKGTQSLELNAFSIEPPQKMFHLIKVNDRVDVDFALVIDPKITRINTTPSTF